MRETINGMPVDTLEYYTWRALAEVPELRTAGDGAIAGAIAQELGLAGQLSVRLALARLVKKGLVYHSEGAYVPAEQARR